MAQRVITVRKWLAVGRLATPFDVVQPGRDDGESFATGRPLTGKTSRVQMLTGADIWPYRADRCVLVPTFEPGTDSLMSNAKQKGKLCTDQ